jgi:hypothetical protein
MLGLEVPAWTLALYTAGVVALVFLLIMTEIDD